MARSHEVVVVVEYDAETSLGLFEHCSDRVASHRRPRGRAAAAVRVPVVRHVTVTVVVGLVERQPTSWMVVMVLLGRLRQRVVMVDLMVRRMLLLMVVLVMLGHRVAVRADDDSGLQRSSVVVERTAAASALMLMLMMQLDVAIVHRDASAVAVSDVRRVQVVRVRGSPTLHERHALLVAEQLPFQAVVFGLQSCDLAPVIIHKNPIMLCYFIIRAKHFSTSIKCIIIIIIIMPKNLKFEVHGWVTWAQYGVCCTDLGPLRKTDE